MADKFRDQLELNELNLLLAIRDMGLEELIARYIHSRTGQRTSITDFPEEVFCAVTALRVAIEDNCSSGPDLWTELLDKYLEDK
ncbi:hypothetical protein [Telluribacter sp.]|jgi:hypothetical protein|uniref:hypothetical protein n=1 Tax=Telluribacter sp. TaxID=1978767 RepID=UPI002E142C0F|nr:hypothetical protein [Telluribacter sp.]